MNFIEEVNALRFFKPAIEATGGAAQVKRALGWSMWFAVKWWDEVFNAVGLSSIRESVFARALFTSLRLRDYIGEDGNIKKRPTKPEYPTNGYAIELVELHESFDRLGAVNVATNRVDENSIGILYSTMLSQGWYKISRDVFLKLVGIGDYHTIFEPVIKEGQTAMAVLEIHTPKFYLGFDYRRDSIEMAAGSLRVKPGECSGAICIYHAATACDAVKIAKRHAPNGVESALLYHTLDWLIDPVKELNCISTLLGSGGKLLIGQQVVESMPAVVAMVAAMGAKHVFSWKGVEQILRAAGYELVKRYLRYLPFYIAMWEPRRRR